MPDKQKHRGLAPKDERLFAPGAWPKLRQAMGDLCWLLDRGYAAHSAVELVGNRYSLVSRQRMAIMRCACSDEEATRRKQREVGPESLKGQELWIDGYNVLTILENALAGGIVLLGRDGCCRDVLGVHSRYRTVEETLPVMRLIGDVTSKWGVSGTQWCLDKPVSNSGRLKALLLDIAAGAGWNWQVELVFNPDGLLAKTNEIIATSDAAILDRCSRWVNLVRLLIEGHIPQAHAVDFSR